MSEKRFVQCEIEYGFANTTNIKKIDGIYDMQGEKTYRIEQIVDVLNEQDNELHKYRTKNAELHITILENEKEIDEQQDQIKDLERKLQICSAHLLSDECCLTDGQIRKIIKEMENE